MSSLITFLKLLNSLKSGRLLCLALLLASLLALAACADTASTGPGEPIARDDRLYGKLVGANFTRTAHPGGGIRWNNCFDFKRPAEISSTVFPEYEWASSIFNPANGETKGVYYTNEVNAAGELILGDTGYFVLRYDITNTALNTYANWTPVTDSPSFFQSQDEVLMEFGIDTGTVDIAPLLVVSESDREVRFNDFLTSKNGTLVGQSVFQIVFFRNRMNKPNNEVKSVQFSFGVKGTFKETASLDSLSAEDLQQEYQAITDDLAEIAQPILDVSSGDALAASFFWVTYRAATVDSIAPGSTHDFEDNENTKTCP